MTLAAVPRPGGSTSPQAFPGGPGLDPDPYQLRFLTAEERQTAVLMGFYQQARLDLEDFIRVSGDLTDSDAVFYRQLLDETNRLASRVNAQGSTWASQVIPDAYSAGWRQNSSVVVPRRALEALSRDTLSLITETTDGIRQVVRNSIAAGILEGLPADQIRARILASGLSNIPHWPSVEYRAGVIARTETMRAYNAGNLAAIEENGARFAEWIASPDEAVCPICGPRDGVVFRLSDGPGPDPYPAAMPLPRIPAHPRCRCTIRARYRDADGKVIGTPNEQAPKLPKDAMGGNVEPPKLPPAVGDFGRAAKGLQGDLSSYLNGGADGIARRTFWRTIGRLDDDQIRTLVDGPKARAEAQMGAFLRLRYGITYTDKAGMTPGLRFRTIRALELIRSVNPHHVVDSPYLTHVGKPPVGAKRFGSNTLARAFLSGQVEWNPGLSKKYEGKYLRINDDGAFEVIVHEFMHSTHYGQGAYADRYGAIGGRFDTQIARDRNAEWRRIRSESSSVSPDARSLAEVQKTIDEFRAAGVTTDAATYKGPYKNVVNLRMLEARLQKLRDALDADTADHEHFPTDYARESANEDFAETGTMYLLDPARLKKWSPKRFDYFERYIFPT